MKPAKFLLLIFIQLYCPFIYADDDAIKIAGLTEDDFLGEVPQVLTISRLRQSTSDAPTASTIIDRKTIEAAGIIDLPEIFRLVPGFYVATNAGFVTNTNHVVSYHGLTDAYARSMQVLIDGRTIYQPLYGGVQWSEIPITIDDIERIEVTRGPNSASYGANAFLGTINIITKQPTGIESNQLSINHGNGRNEAFYHRSGKINDLNYWLSAGYREDDGLSQRFDFKRTNLLNVKGQYFISNKNDIEFQFGYAEGQRQEGAPLSDTTLAILYPERMRDTYNHFELIKWNSHLSSNQEFYIQAFHIKDHSEDTITMGPLTSLSAFASPAYQSFDNPYEFERFDIETQLTSTLNDRFEYAIGGSVRRDRLYAPFWIGDKDSNIFDLRRVFGQIQYDIHPKVTLNAGVMIEDNDFTGTDTSPRGSVNFHITPNQTLRLGYSEAYRTPSYMEEKFRGSLYFTTTAPPTRFLYQRFYNEGNLDPEKIQSREIGYIGIWEKVSIDAKIFHDTISNYIDGFDNNSFVTPANTILIGDVGTSRNFGSFDTRGFETQIKLTLTPSTKLMVNYAHVRNFPNNVKYNHVDDIIDATPTDVSSFLITHNFNADWDGSFAGYYNSPVKAFGDGNAVDTNYRFDARIAKKFTYTKLSGQVSLNIQNITDRHEKEFADYNELRRRAYLNVKLDF